MPRKPKTEIERALRALDLLTSLQGILTRARDLPPKDLRWFLDCAERELAELGRDQGQGQS